MQQILLLLQAKGHLTPISEPKHYSNGDIMPWIEVKGELKEFPSAQSPRLRVSHLGYKFMPSALSQKKGKVSSLITHVTDHVSSNEGVLLR